MKISDDEHQRILGWLILPVLLLIAAWEHGSALAEDIWYLLRDAVKGELI